MNIPGSHAMYEVLFYYSRVPTYTNRKTQQVFDTQLQNGIALGSYEMNGAAFSFNSNREYHNLRVPSVGSSDLYNPVSTQPGYSPYNPVDRNATTLPTNPVISELSRDILVQPRGKDNPVGRIYSLDDIAL